jgi:peroxiredoxin (alkyl hydroperoxide reductase subunit C)
MKTTLLILGIMILSFQLCYTQSNDSINSRPLISGTAPSFKAVSTMGTINFPNDYYGKWKILFSHPADFTPVCTSEMIALAAIQSDFKDLNTVLIGISTDGLNSHMAWVQSIDTISAKGSAPVKVNFPIITDADLKISKMYGIVQTDSMGNKDIRGVFIIDPYNKIRAFFYYPKTVGRNVQEIKRTLIALQTEDKHNVLIPANWQPGDDVLMKSPKTMKEAQKMEAKKDPKLRELAWYMWYIKL